MPVHDYHCEPCDIFILDQYHPSISAVLCCPDCGHPCEKLWHRPPRELFRAFTVDYGKGPVEITSLAQLRAIEASSEKAYRDGRGQPLVFRAFSQDHSNLDRNTLERYGYQQRRPDPARSNVKGGLGER